MIRSMTGFGQAEGTVGTSRVLVEVRTVNHRFFSPSIKVPGAYGRWETEVREAMRLKVSRGHVTLTARSERLATPAIAIDDERFAAVVAQLRDLHDRHGLSGGVDLATVLRMPDVMSAPREEEDTGTAADLVAIVERALDHLGRARAEEGARLATVLRERLDLVDAALQRIAIRAPERLMAQRDRLRAAVKELAEGLAVDETRLAQEIAILADRMDVSEELDRFRSHITAFHSVLADADAGGEPVGKRLGFLLQEMLREANTTGSKAADAAILHDVVGVKEELERIREQVENLE
ncbi:YicC/YloC family endoribonuclease [Gemmatimonas sp.]|uniref:YicC/YloC family endoribonuclease n=1 Tax=Gemmatimonas sp. TaxID=1962908 RepID=UPI00286DF2F0|nr:YicC/YloC family endoribonuclease [Gemmatimonas sp.]